MAYGDRPIGMDHPSQWLAVLRIVVGLYFAKAILTKLGIVLLGGVVPLPAASERWIAMMPVIVAKQAAGNPLLFYKTFLEQTVLTHPALFAHLTAWGEALVGIGLTFGLLTGAASLVGLWLVIVYGLASYWMSPSQPFFHIMIGVLMVAFFFARAGRTWGVDGRIARRRPKSAWTRRPIA